jgi:hypothetical protein
MNLDYLPEGWTLAQAMEHVDFLQAMYRRIQGANILAQAPTKLFERIWMFKEAIAAKWGDGMDRPCEYIGWTTATL